MATKDKDDLEASTANPVITVRGMLLGALTAAAMLYYVVVVGQGIGAGRYVNSQFPMTAIMPFVLWLFVNTLLKWLTPSYALSRGELLTILTMLWVVGIMPQRGWMSFWVAIMAGPTILATQENNWAEIFFDYLPWHVFAPTKGRILDPFFFGLEEGMPLPWDGWAGVMGQWMVVCMAMVVFGYCLILLFQKHWEEGEKLTFPLAQFPLDLTQGFDGQHRVPDLFRQRLFWGGFLLVFLVLGYNVVTYFVPGLPLVEIWTKRFPVQLGEEMPYVTFRVLPIVMAVTYLCPVDILGSLVLFHLLYLVKEGLIRRSGFVVDGFSGVGATGQIAEYKQIIFMESYGALIFVALWSFWLARTHLQKVWQMVWWGGENRSEVGRYRFAVLGLAGSAAYVIVWGMSLGMGLPLALLAFLVMVLTYFVIVKLIAATGFSYLFPNEPHAKGQSFIAELVGTVHLAPREVVAYKVFASRAFFGDTRIPAWPAITHHLRSFASSKQPVWVAAAVLVAFPVGFLVTATATIDLSYQEGSSAGLSGFLFNDLVSLMNNPSVATVGKWLVWGAGFVEAAVIAFLRGRYQWFPLHPIGLAFQATSGVWVYWFSLFLVWMVKVALLRYGGVVAFMKGNPFFYGMAVGYVIGVTLSGCVDLVWFPTGGHRMHAW